MATGFQCVLYTNNSDRNVVDKQLTQQFDLSILLKDSTSITDPTLIFSYTSSQSIPKYKLVNYAYIPTFRRYYFVNNFRWIRDQIVELDCHVDVLMSFKAEIRANRAIILRQEKEYNLYLNDGVFKVYQNPVVLTREFPAGFTSQSFVMAVAGS